jgi:hypothetical protein
VDKIRQAHLPFALPGLPGENVAMAGLFPFQAAAGSGFEAFGRAPVSFDFWHDLSSSGGVLLAIRPLD